MAKHSAQRIRPKSAAERQETMKLSDAARCPDNIEQLRLDERKLLRSLSLCGPGLRSAYWKLYCAYRRERQGGQR